MSKVLLTLEISQDTYDKLVALAETYNVTVPELSSTFVEDGASLLLDPEEIKTSIEAEKNRLINAARMMPIPRAD
ncbi:hypothetical protein EON76_05825 [bacterium]|nr:MAG: hypothetical protein EON76_05825 [bacterium]